MKIGMEGERKVGRDECRNEKGGKKKRREEKRKE